MTSADPIAFFDVALRHFERAQNAKASPVNLDYSIAGYSIRLSFAGPALVPAIAPAFEHLLAPPSSAPDLTICLWDSHSAGIAMPPPPWSAEAYGARCGVEGYNTKQIRTAYNRGTQTLTTLDHTRDVAVFWTRDARAVPYYESGAPLLPIFHWWMAAHDRQLVHAGALGNERSGVLLAGRGGSGKSSTCLRALDSPLFYAGDDYCIVSATPAPYVHSLYSTGKVDPQDVEGHPLLAPALSNGDALPTEKALFFLHPRFAHKLRPGFPIRAILLPRVTGRPETALRKVPSSAALLALAPSTIFQLPGAGRETFQDLSRMIRQVPSYVLEVGTDFAAIPRAISELLDQLQ